MTKNYSTTQQVRRKLNRTIKTPQQKLNAVQVWAGVIIVDDEKPTVSYASFNLSGIVRFVEDVRDAVSFTAKVFSIAFNSLAWGLL